MVIKKSRVSISVVSHNNREEVIDLILALNKCSGICKIIVTHNIPEKLIKIKSKINFDLEFIHNKKPKGFGENHNFAFKYCNSDYFVVLNPDIKGLDKNIFLNLIKNAKKNNAKLVAPRIKNLDGSNEDNERIFPNIYNLFLYKLLPWRPNLINNKNRKLEWVGGMFMMFHSKSFFKLNGFDEKYFLYFEDVDICVRFKKLNLKISVDSQSFVFHYAKRDSHRKIKYLIWHLKSLLIYINKYPNLFFRVF